MESIEDKLKKIIIEKYGSLKKFSSEIAMPYTTLDSIFKRGLKNCASQNLVKIGSALGINASLLILEERIVPFHPSNKLAQSAEWQEKLANNAQLTLEIKEILTGMFQNLKEVINENDKNNIFTGIPEEDLLYYFWKLKDDEQEKILRIIQNSLTLQSESCNDDESEIVFKKKINVSEIKNLPINRSLLKIQNEETLEPEEQQALDDFIQSGGFQRAFKGLSESTRKLANLLRQNYELLNEEGRKKADKHIEYAAEQIELLTKIPEYIKED